MTFLDVRRPYRSPSSATLIDGAGGFVLANACTIAVSAVIWAFSSETSDTGRADCAGGLSYADRGAGAQSRSANTQFRPRQFALPNGGATGFETRSCAAFCRGLHVR